MLTAALLAGAFVVTLSAGMLAASAALKADALDFAAAGLGYGLSFRLDGKGGTPRVVAMLVARAVLVLLGAMVAASTFYAFFVRETPEPTLMGAGALVALAANGGVLYLLRGERTTGRLHGAWVHARNDLVGSAAVLISAGVVVLVDNSVPDLTVAGVIVVLFLIEAIAALRGALADWEALRAATPASAPPKAGGP